MILQVQKVAVSRWNYIQKANENVAMQNKASPSLATQFLKNYQEQTHLTQAQLTEDVQVKPRTLHVWKNASRRQWRSQRDESCR
jgi:hypothetical protein